MVPSDSIGLTHLELLGRISVRLPGGGSSLQPPSPGDSVMMFTLATQSRITSWYSIDVGRLSTVNLSPAPSVTLTNPRPVPDCSGEPWWGRICRGPRFKGLRQTGNEPKLYPSPPTGEATRPPYQNHFSIGELEHLDLNLVWIQIQMLKSAPGSDGLTGPDSFPFSDDTHQWRGRGNSRKRSRRSRGGTPSCQLCSEFRLIQEVDERRQEVTRCRVRAAPAHHVGNTDRLTHHTNRRCVSRRDRSHTLQQERHSMMLRLSIHPDMMLLEATETSVISDLHGGPLAPSAGPDTGKVYSARTEAPSCHGGSRHTRRHLHLWSLRSEQHQNDKSLSDRDSYTLKERQTTSQTWRLPGGVIVKRLTSLTVLPSCVVLTDTATVNLDEEKASLSEDVPTSSVHRDAAAGVSVTEAASLNHHAVKRVVIFLLRISASASQQRVTKREETSEVHTDVRQDPCLSKDDSGCRWTRLRAALPVPPSGHQAGGDRSRQGTGPGGPGVLPPADKLQRQMSHSERIHCFTRCGSDITSEIHPEGACSGGVEVSASHGWRPSVLNAAMVRFPDPTTFAACLPPSPSPFPVSLLWYKGHLSPQKDLLNPPLKVIKEFLLDIIQEISMEVFGGPKENPAGGCGCCKGAPTGGGGAKKIWKTERSPLWKLEEDPLKWEVSVFTTDVITASPSFCNFLSVSRPLKGMIALSLVQLHANNMSTTNMNMTSRVIFYEDRNFQGRSYDCSSDCADMSSYLSRCHSCRVERGCFMVYDRTNYMGNQYFMRRGEYADYMSMMGMSDCIRSCRMIPMYRGSYRMRIYERENYGGQMYEMMDDCDNIMDRYRMSNCMSCHVMDGHWLMYEQPHYRGRMMYMRPGEYRNFTNMGWSNMRFMSMRRIMDSYY
ncbi:hypothetical protein CCH79_00010184 [Gambusia affinis]|uniref:Beta/gamma crystallin 'Greek key' domain-containing protein n=2 Tax=Gambusia affinis TaxID=33528 RepID=A0A315VNE9_GAMAF|nr:hypothetical protein CCH79_00010184 [Gambusia affinis]